MSLHDGSHLAHYEIRSQLGKGGMGEVYRAYDPKLQRHVAIKVLPKKGADPVRLKRFKREVLSASSLNHRNIITVHDFGQTRELYYIVTELIEGITLRRRMRDEIRAGEAIDICIQVGKALAAAHAALIIHRDVKPENVMLSPPDNHVKVLDFGLAKALRRPEIIQNGEGDSTVSILETEPGAFVGTIGYMSPEQLRQKPADEQSDIWSLGIVLFEALTSARPFAKESASETIAAILNQPVPELTVSDPQVGAQLNAIIEKALSRENEKRYAAMGDLVADLEQVLQAVGPECRVSINTSQSAVRAAAPAETTDKIQKPVDTPPEPARSRLSFVTKRPWLSLLGLMVSIAGSLIFFGFVFNSETESVLAPLDYKNRPLSNAGNVVKAAVAPEGRSVAYIVENADGLQSLRIGDMDYLPASSRELIPTAKVNYSGLTFSPDGNYLYYVVFKESEEDGNENTTGTLYRRLRESDSQPPQEILKDVDSPVTFSPDGSKLAYIQVDWRAQKDKLIVANSIGGDKRVLLERSRPDFITTSAARESPAWSPNGESIACPVGGRVGNNEFMSIVSVNVRDGRETSLTSHRWTRVGRIAWLPSGRELLATVADSIADVYQVAAVSTKTGTVRPFTRDQGDYLELSMTPDSKKVVTIQSDRKSALWIGRSSDPGNPERMTAHSYDALWGGVWQDNGHLTYTSFENGVRDLWRVSVDGGERRQLTFDPEANDTPAVSPDGKYIVFTSERNPEGGGKSVSHIWRVDSDGAGLKQITNGEGEYFPQVTADGKWIVYTAGTRLKTLWRIPVEGGEAVHLTEELANWPAISPDGKMVAALTIKGEDEQFTLGVFSVETGGSIKNFAVQAGTASPTNPAILRWTPDGKNVSYAVVKGNVSNLWTQPLTGGKAKPMTSFTTDTIFWFDWSKDGSRIVYSRGVINNKMVLFWIP